MEHAGAKNVGKSEGESMDVTENRESAYELGKYSKVEERMDVKAAGKSLVEDRAGGSNTIAGRGLIEDRAGGPAGIADKSLDVTVGFLGGAAKSETKIVKRLEMSMISGTRVPITSNLNNPALVSPPFASSQLSTKMSASMPASFVSPRRGLGSLSFFTHALKTTPEPQVPLWG